jgi:two-component system, OmpR family, response regulator
MPLAGVPPVCGAFELCKGRGMSAAYDDSAASVKHVKPPSTARGLVLVVEDERSIADVHRLYLSREGFGVHVATDGQGALDAASQLRPVAIILDIGLPEVDGVEVLSTLRTRGDWTPVIVVTARDDETDKIVGLELGADDYLTKPFSPRELIARLKAVLRRGQTIDHGRLLESGSVSLDPQRRVVVCAGRRVDLTATEFRLLEELLLAAGKVLSREELMARAWGQADYGASRTVDVHVAQVRTKLGADSPIVTVRGVGYRVEDG